MTQTLHIFGKDVRRFRYELSVIAALTAAFAWSHVAADIPAPPGLNRPRLLAGLTAVVLAGAWWFLLSELIHEDPLAGDRQFWITRPYSWRHLLAAKLLFVVAFVNVPLLVAQLAILAAAGFQPVAARLLWMHIEIAAVLLIPPFALATLTRNLAQFVLVIPCALLSWYILMASLSGVALRATWPKQALTVCAVCLGAALIVAWQFAWRATNTSVVAGLLTLLVAAVLYLGLPLRVASAIQSLAFPQVAQVSLSVSVTSSPKLYRGQDLVQFPFTIAGVPAGEVAWPEMLRITIEGPSGQRWSSGWQTAWWAYPIPAPVSPLTAYPLNVFVPRDFYPRMQGGPVVIHGSMFLTLRQLTIVPLPPGHATRIPGGGFCRVSPVDNQYAIFCSSPFRQPFDTSAGSGWDIDHGPTGIGTERHSWMQLQATSESPFPDFALSPVLIQQTGSDLGAEISLVKTQPRAWVERSFAARVTLPPEH